MLGRKRVGYAESVVVAAEGPLVSGIVITILFLALALIPARSWRAVAPGIDSQVIAIARLVLVVLALMGVSAMIVLNTTPIR